MSEVPREEQDGPPPLLRSWRNVYALVLAELAIVVAAMYALTRWAS